MDKNTGKRQSGIELLKLLVMFLIVTAHVIQSVGQISVDNPVYNGNVVNLCEATDNIQFFLMALIWNFVMFAVDVFFVSSAWFLTDSKGVKKNKAIRIIADVWIVSVIFLIIYKICGVPVSGKLAIKSLFPTLFANNWFITCYLIMYLIHPLLNIICSSIDQKKHRLIVAAGLAYCLVTYISEYLLFYSKILVLMIMYLTVAYVKKYLKDKADDVKLNRLILAGSFAANVLIIGLINVLGKNVGFLHDMLMHSNTMQNPFLIMMAVSIFDLFRCKHISNGTINSLAGLTMYVYIIHENILFKTYTRPLIWDTLLRRYGYDHILVCVLIFAGALYICAFAAGKLYDMTVERLLGKRLQ